MEFANSYSKVSKDGGEFWQGRITGPVTSSDATSIPLTITGTPDIGKIVRIDDLFISTDTTMLITIRTKTTQTVIDRFRLGADLPIQRTPRNGLKSIKVNEAVELIASVSGNIYVTCNWHSE